MSRRRKKTEPALPLFDLPLFDDEGGEGGAENGVGNPASEPQEAAAPPAPPEPPSAPAVEAPATAAPPGEAQLLFSEEDLIPVAPKRGEQFAEEGVAEGEGGEIDAPFQDRWLGGLADLTIHLATLGAMVLAVRMIGVTVALEDAPAFLVLGLVFSLLYTIVPLAFWGQTPGMAWVGHLARSEGNEPLTFGQTFLRWLGSILTVALLGLPVLLGLTGRSLCDRLSDSRTYQI
jgi:uncharacterized RDD family membrane protein YckC